MASQKSQSPQARKVLACVLPPATALAIALGGCASWSPPAQVVPDMVVPVAWSTTAATSGAPATSLAQWWQRFNDPLLSSLVSQALQANTSIQSARAALQQSRALRDVKGAGLLPNVSGAGSAQRGKSGGLEASNSFRVGLDASWEIDVFGGNRSALSAAEADAQAAAATLADVKISVDAE